MDPSSFPVSHVGSGLEVTFLDYVGRVLLHLLLLGGVAVLVSWGSSAVAPIRSAFAAEPSGDARER